MIELITSVDVAAMVALTVGVVQVFKTAGMSKRYAPLMSLVCGIVFMTAFKGHDWYSIFEGMVVGLTACGLWSGSKTTFRA